MYMKTVLCNTDVVVLTKALTTLMLYIMHMYVYHACITAHHINMKVCRYMHSNDS